MDLHVYRLIRVLAVSLVAAALPQPAPAVELGDIMQVNRARSLAVRGDHENAIAILEAELAAIASGDARERAALLRDIARYNADAGRYSQAAEALQRLATAVAQSGGPSAPGLSPVYEEAAAAFALAGDRQQALHYYERALDIDRRYLSCDSPVLSGVLSTLADLRAQAGDVAEAERLRMLAQDEQARCEDARYNPPRESMIVKGRPRDGARAGFTSVSVYYGTDRARTGSMRPDTFYGSGRGNLEFGVLDVTVPRTHKPGNVEAPSLVLFEWTQNPDRHIVIGRLETLGEDRIMARMRAALEESNSDEAFVFVHGYNVTFADAAKRTAQIAYDLNFEGIPFLYSWPSLGNPFGYIADEAVVELGGRRLIRILDGLAARSGVRRIHIVAHSMGARALADALELMAMRSGSAVSGEPPFDQVLFAAPDIDIDLFAEMTKRFRPLTRRLTLYASDADSALETSRSLHGENSRAGEAGGNILISDAVDTIDMSQVGDGMLGHSYFAANTSGLSDMLWLFWRDDDPDIRCGMRQSTGGRGVHWRYETARCDGDVALSALTLLRSQGPGALDHALSRLDELQGNNTPLREEWRAITEIIRSALGG